MRKIGTAFCMLVFAIAISGCTSYGKPVITVENHSSLEIENAVVETRNNSVSLGSIPNLGSKMAELPNPFGESGIRLGYSIQGEQKGWEGGYIESSGCYKVRLTIEEDGNVTQEADLGCY